MPLMMSRYRWAKHGSYVHEHRNGMSLKPKVVFYLQTVTHTCVLKYVLCVFCVVFSIGEWCLAPEDGFT